MTEQEIAWLQSRKEESDKLKEELEQLRKANAELAQRCVDVDQGAERVAVRNAHLVEEDIKLKEELEKEQRHRANASVAVIIAQEYLDERDATIDALRAVADREAVEMRRLKIDLELLKHDKRHLTKERDAHRKALNQIADELNVVHEDPKILEAMRKLQDRLYKAKLDSSELQLACLALAECALRRPGFDYALTELARRLGDHFDIEGKASLFDRFKQTSSDLVKPIGSLLDPPPS